MVALLDVVSVLATVALVLMLLGPAPDAWQMVRTKSTGVAPLLPLATLFTNSLIWTIYGYLDDAIFPVAVCNFTGVVLATVYASVFYRFTTDRPYAHKVLGGFGLLSALALAYAFVGGFGATGQSRESVKNVFGYVGVVTVLVFFGSTFENIAQVLKFRSGVFIPIVLIAAGAVNSALWVLYALLDSDWFIFVPNAGAFAIACVQIALYFTFHPATHPYEPAVDDPTKDLEASRSAVAGGVVTSPSFVSLQSPRATRV